MKRFLLTTVATIALAGTAHAAPQMPKELQGVWCGNLRMEATNNCDDDKMTVTPKGWEMEFDYGCRVIKVARLPDFTHGGKRAPKNPWSAGYRFTFKCSSGDAKEAKVIESWQPIKDYVDITPPHKF